MFEPPKDLPLLRGFRFWVVLTKTESGNPEQREYFGDGAFQECGGLQIELDVQEYVEGGRNDGVVRQVGRAKYQNIVLKRGMFYNESGEVNRDLWKWLQGIASGERPVVRYDGVVTVMKVGYEVGAKWEFYRGLPVQVRGPELNAKTGEVGIEELHIAHEGLRMVSA